MIDDLRFAICDLRFQGVAGNGRQDDLGQDDFGNAFFSVFGRLIFLSAIFLSDLQFGGSGGVQRVVLKSGSYLFDGGVR